MNRANVWAAGAGVDGAADGGPEVIEAVLSWRDAASGNALGVREVKAGGVLALGEGGDLLVPAEVLGTGRAEVLRFDGETATVLAPPGAALQIDGQATDRPSVELAAGHEVRLLVGAFVLRLSRGQAGERPAAAAIDGLRGPGVATFGGSALLHGAVFAAIAFIAPSLGATEVDAYDRDRILLMQALLNASAQHEEERKPDDGGGATANEVAPGAAAGPAGQAGRVDTSKTDGRMALKGTATPQERTLPRERVLAEAADFGVIGMLATLPVGDPNAPVVPWGSTLNGSDDVTAAGHIYGSGIGDAIGTGGLGLTGSSGGGSGIGDYGTGTGIGLKGFGSLGSGRCGDGCIGSGIGHSGTPFKPKGPRMRQGNVEANGHLPAEIIQRIVRQNSGRYVFCYQNALKPDPNLAGRVTARFVIGRDGAVQVAADGGSDIPNEGVRRCVVSSFTNLSFPAPESGTVTVSYPIAFSPE